MILQTFWSFTDPLSSEIWELSSVKTSSRNWEHETDQHGVAVSCSWASFIKYQQTPGASFIKETILNLILRSYLEYAYVWFIAWTYEQKTHVRVSFRCEIYEWQIILNLHAIEWFQLSACKRLLINVINIYNITNHHNLEQRAARTAYI